MTAILLALCLGACKEEKTGGTPDDPDTACNEANEDCDPDLCGGEGGTMLPGSNCLACHGGGGGEAPEFAFAGTVFADLDGTGKAEGVTVRITDAAGDVIELTSNSAGNFYSQAPIDFPIQAEVEVDGSILSMTTEPTEGACNSCHACEGAAGGKLYAP